MEIVREPKDLDGFFSWFHSIEIGGPNHPQSGDLTKKHVFFLAVFDGDILLRYTVINGDVLINIGKPLKSWIEWCIDGYTMGTMISWPSFGTSMNWFKEIS